MNNRGTQLAPETLLRQYEAVAMLNISRTTFMKWERAGKILPEDFMTIGKKKVPMYRVRDLEKLKYSLQPYSGKRGRPAGPKLDEPTQTTELTIADDQSLSAGLMDAAGIDRSLTHSEGQQAIRQQLIMLAARNKIIQRLFRLLESPDPGVQLRAIEKILNKILPDLKTVEQFQYQEQPKETPELQQNIQQLREDIARLRQAASMPVIETTVKVIEVEDASATARTSEANDSPRIDQQTEPVPYGMAYRDRDRQGPSLSFEDA